MLSINKKILLTLFIVSLSFSCQPFTRLFNNGGTELIIQVELDEPNNDKLFQQALKTLESRLNAVGFNGEVRQVDDKPNQISVKLYGENDVEKIKKHFLSTYRLELKKVVSSSSPSPLATFPSIEAATQTGIKDNHEVLPYKDRDGTSQKFIIVEKESIVTGVDVRSASAINHSGTYSIAFSLKPEGAVKLGDWTGKNINNYLAIVVNKEVISAAFIKSQIFDSGQIDGRFTKETAEDIALNLNSGYFPGTLKIIEEKTFGNAGK